MVIDMTTGKPVKKLIAFLIPILLGNLLQQFYSMADSVIVSRFLGVTAFAGVTSTGSLNYLIIGFATGLCAGCSIPMAQEFGAGDYSKMRRFFANSFYLAGALAIFIGVTTFLLTPAILHAMGSPEDIFPYSSSYISLIFLGLPATVLYNLLAGGMHAIGDGKTPLIMLIISSGLNILLDLFFVLILHMSVAGAAAATVLSQLISALLCLIVIVRKIQLLRISRSEWAFSRELIAKLSRIGIPMGLQCSITAIGSILMQSAVNSLGSASVAAFGAGTKIQSLYLTPISSMGTTIATYCGQNFGARRMDRVRSGVLQAVLVMLGYCVIAFSFNALFGHALIRLFVGSGDAVLIENTFLYLKTILSLFFLVVIVMIFRNSVQGLGYSKAAMFAGIMELIGRLFVSKILVRVYGYPGACFASPVSWFCADLLLIPMFFIILRKQARLLKETSSCNHSEDMIK